MQHIFLLVSPESRKEVKQQAYEYGFRMLLVVIPYHFQGDKKMKLYRLITFITVVSLSLAALGASYSPAKAQDPLSGTLSAGQGASSSAALYRSVVLDKIATEPQAPDAQLAGTLTTVPFRSGLSQDQLNALKQRITPKNAPAIAAPAAEAPRAVGGEAQTPGASANFNGLTNLNALSPADMALAVGSTYVLQATNSSIAIYSKSGVVEPGYPKSLKSFLGLSSGFLFDPRALYDSVKKRFIVVIDRSMGSTKTSKFYVAVSQTSDPRGAWWIYVFNYGGADDFGDFPMLGQDSQGIYVCFNTFSNSTGSFVNSKCFLLPKAGMYAGLGISYWWQFGFNVSGTMLDTLQPVNSNGLPRAEFMVNSFNINFGGGQCFSGCSGLVVWAISNPFGFASGGPSPQFTGYILGTSTYYLPPNADAPGCSGCVSTNDPRISGTPVYNAGSIFAGLNTRVYNGVQNVSGIQWFEITPYLNDNGDGTTCTGSFTNKCAWITGASLKQEGWHYYGGTGSAYYGTLHPDRENNIIMAFNYSASDRLPQTAWVGRRVTQTPNSFHDGGFYLNLGSGSVTTTIRWGDYTATAGDGNKIWFSGMYNFSTNNWKTRIGASAYSNNFTP